MKAARLALAAVAIAGPVLLAVPTAHALADVTRSAAARPAAACELTASDAPTASAKLTFSLPYTDEPGWASTITVTVPTSWPYAAGLLMSNASSAFRFAYGCLLPSGAPVPTSVRLGNGDITLKSVDRGEIADWYLWLPPPWSITYDHRQPPVVSFQPQSSFSGVTWTTAAISVQGFTITSPTPLPASDNADSTIDWNHPSPSGGDRYSIRLVLPTLLRMELTAETGPGEGQYAPYDGEEAAFAIVLALLLSRRRRDPVEVPKAIGSPVRLLCVIVAVLASVQFVQDIQSQTALSYQLADVGYALQEAIQIIATCVAAIAMARLQGGRAWRALSMTAVVVGLLNLANPIGRGLLVAHISAFQWLHNPGRGAELFQIVTAASLYFLCWLIPLSAIPGLVRQSGARGMRLSRTSIAVFAASVLTAASVFLAIRGQGLSVGYVYDGLYATPDYNVFNSFQILRLMAGFVIVFGVIGVVAVRRRKVSILLEKRDRVLLAVATGYAMLVALPQSYLGVHVGLVSVFAAAVTYAVLTASRANALAQRARSVLLGMSQEQMVRVQGQLVAAEKRLTEVTDDLKKLGTTPVGAGRMEKLEQLAQEEDQLRRWPADERPPARRRPWYLPTWLRPRQVTEPEPVGERLPKPATPIDMALALGSPAGPPGNLRAAFWPGIALAAVPSCYFAWHDVSAGTSLWQALQDYSLPLVIIFSRELTFWLFPMLLLALAWSSLTGLRGTSRALQVWACIAASIGVHVAITQAIGQSGTLNTVLRCGLLVICMLLFGLALDLLALRRFGQQASPFAPFRGYFRFNGLSSTLTLVIPLVSALLTIVAPIESGAVTTRISPSQGQAVATPTQSPPAPHVKHSR